MPRKSLKENPLVNEDSSAIEICFEHVKRVYENQLSSSGDLDSKASSLLNTTAAMVTLIFLSMTYLFGKDSFINTNDISFNIAAVGIIICFGLLVYSGWTAILAYRCKTINDIADPMLLLDLYVERYKNTNKILLLENLSVSYAEAANNYSESNKTKAKSIISSQRCFRWSLIALFLVILILSYNAFITIRGGENMAKTDDETKKPVQISRPADKLRNPNLKPMQAIGRQILNEDSRHQETTTPTPPKKNEK